MLSRTIHRGRAYVVAGVVVLAGGLAICQATPLCARPAAARAKKSESTSTLGAKPMIVTEEKPRVEHADETTFDRLVRNSTVPVLVDFYADWCGPCRRLAPVLDELAAEMPQARIVKVNVDHSPRLAAEYGVDAIPSVKVFNNGVVTAEQVGLASKSELRAMLSR